MPFAYAVSSVSILAKKGGDGDSVGLDKGRIESVEDPVFQAGSPAVATGQDSISGRRADGGGGMSVGEAHPLGSHAVNMRSGELCCLIVTTDISNPHVVCQDVDNVGMVSGYGRRDHRKESEQKEARHALLQHDMAGLDNLSRERLCVISAIEISFFNATIQG